MAGTRIYRIVAELGMSETISWGAAGKSWRVDTTDPQVHDLKCGIGEKARP